MPTTLYDLPTFVTPLTVALMMAICAVVLIKNLHPDAAARIGRVVFLFAAMTDNQNSSRPNLSKVGFNIGAIPNLRHNGFFNNGNLIGRINLDDDQPIEEEISLREGFKGLENTTT
ncbi:hypothetical protein K450DRAFT_240293 [Umbelopsis ramanniana AG]|uniref:Uncharacterized protein n=1 Tax=Umbelopsis ramanniana AG TaxID=1314678 RepID=A0AAD5EAK8_UMBRA|nr:uncharacterized protein K450DRAFT_240293 [Umbelopsis ramanniana AG]KAI8579777.1 hypothetical protein K450DRAFT_240293 [Umbelopsis ramanniana AG]